MKPCEEGTRCPHVEFPKTHDIGKLRDLVASVDGGLEERVREAEDLSVHGVDVRYPGDLPELRPGEVLSAVQVARRVRSAVLARIEPRLSGKRDEQ